MGRAFLALCLLPALLLGPVFGGVTAWIHSHCHSGGHVHLIQDGRVREVVNLVEWHDSEHRHAHEAETLDGRAREGRAHGERGHHEHEEEHDGPTPKGLLIVLPEFVAAPPRGSSVLPEAGPQALALALARLPLELAGHPARPGGSGPGGRPRGAERSGVAALLCSSHAIRI